jgi:hypothetical protein
MAVRLKGNTTYLLEIRWDGVAWTDETSRMEEFAIERGTDEDGAGVRAGTLNLTLKDTTGRFNPANASSPLQPYITYPLRQVRLSVTYSSTTYWLFTGYTRRHESDPGRTTRQARIDCVDGFLLLDAARPLTATGATTGAAIASILTEVGFAGATDLDTGDVITYAADGSETALAAIANMLTTERGFFFISASGTATYLDRYAPNRSPYTSSQGTIASTMRAIAPGIDLDQMYNRATVTKEGGTTQTIADTSGPLGTLIRDYPSITSPYLASDAAALSLVYYLVSKYKNPVPPVRFLDLNNGNTTSWVQMLTRELGDRVTVTESLGGTSGDYHIRRITHSANWGQGIHRGSWSLQQRDTMQPFLIGVSNIGGTDVITY